MKFTKIDTREAVDKLVDKFGERFALVSHEDISAVIGAAYNSYRYNSILSAWRQHLYKIYNVHVICVRGKGYRPGTPKERIVWAQGKIVSADKMIDRACNVATTTRIRAKDYVGIRQSIVDLYQKRLNNEQFSLFDVTSPTVGKQTAATQKQGPANNVAPITVVQKQAASNKVKRSIPSNSRKTA